MANKVVAGIQAALGWRWTPFLYITASSLVFPVAVVLAMPERLEFGGAAKGAVARIALDEGEPAPTAKTKRSRRPAAGAPTGRAARTAEPPAGPGVTPPSRPEPVVVPPSPSPMFTPAPPPPPPPPMARPEPPEVEEEPAPRVLAPLRGMRPIEPAPAPEPEGEEEAEDEAPAPPPGAPEGDAPAPPEPEVH